MTWAGRLFERVKVVYFPDDKGNEQSVETALKLDDLDSAVLEKNREIEKELKQRKEKHGTPNSSLGTYRKIEQARAFSELAEESKKRNAEIPTKEEKGK